MSYLKSKLAKLFLPAHPEANGPRPRMRSKALAVFAPLALVAAFAAVPAMASAAGPHWTQGGVLIPEGVSVTAFTSSSQLVLNDPVANLELTCEAVDEGTVENPKGKEVGEKPGIDSITFFENVNCISPQCPAVATTEARGLPWSSELVEVGGVIRDEISGIEIGIFCGPPGEPKEQLSYSGTLSPRIEEGVAVFDGEAGGHLTSSKGTPGFVTGVDSIQNGTGQAIGAIS